MGPQLVSHGIPTIDTLNENSGIWSPATSSIRKTPNPTHESAYDYIVSKGIVVVSSVGDYGGDNYKTDF